jgi:adenosylmethionine-8-amino-7-oxononanoate aminotransferase
MFRPLMLETYHVPGPNCYRCPYGQARATCAAECFAPLGEVLETHGHAIAAVFIEPMVQCANGMNIYSPVYLQKMRAACDAAGVHLVADEIAVGFGRTGRWFGCEHAGIEPDFMCVSKGLTGGYMPFSAVIVRDEEVFDAFYGPYDEFKAFYHSHSYTGNPMACRLALEVIAELEEAVLPRLPERVAQLANVLERFEDLPHVGETRQCGLIGAVEFVADVATKHAFPVSERVGWQIYRAALRQGAFLRPLGDVLYFMPALTIEPDVLDELGTIAVNAAREVLAS